MATIPSRYRVVRSHSWTNDRVSKGYVHVIPRIAALFPPGCVVDCDVKHEEGCPAAISGSGMDCDCFPHIEMRQLEPKE
jgi:hypothetical protein